MSTNQSQRKNISSAIFSQSEATPLFQATVPELVTYFPFLAASRDHLIERHLLYNLIHSTCAPGSS